VTASVLIIIVSAALLVYWFRYTCLLILRTRSGKDFSAGFAAANDLAYVAVRESTSAGTSGQSLSALEKSLERDYRLLTYLLHSTAGAQVAGVTIEQRLLMFDYRLMQLVLRVTRRLWPLKAREAVLEMTEVLRHLANDLGERASAASNA
jgi:hypothetical protein